MRYSCTQSYMGCLPKIQRSCVQAHWGVSDISGTDVDHVPSRRRVEDRVVLPVALVRPMPVMPLDQYTACQVAKMTITSEAIREARGRIVTWGHTASGWRIYAVEEKRHTP